jgi:hypothetical protein
MNDSIVCSTICCHMEYSIKSSWLGEGQKPFGKWMLEGMNHDRLRWTWVTTAMPDQCIWWVQKDMPL